VHTNYEDNTRGDWIQGCLLCLERVRRRKEGQNGKEGRRKEEEGRSERKRREGGRRREGKEGEVEKEGGGRKGKKGWKSKSLSPMEGGRPRRKRQGGNKNVKKLIN
jgi:hypothetical protein